jgi:hypothetical protein
LRTRIGLILVAVLLATTGPARAVVTEYTNETDYLNALSAVGSGSFQETFDDDGSWGSLRFPATAPSVLSLGILWTANNDNSGVSTSSGPARSGWAIFSSPHGDFLDGIGCDVPEVCGDGLVGTSADVLLGVGGWISGFAGADIVFILDGDNLNPITFDGAPPFTGSSEHLFFGVIDTNGFTNFEIREIEGTLGDQQFIWADDFTIAVPEPSRATLSAAAMMTVAFLVLYRNRYRDRDHPRP